MAKQQIKNIPPDEPLKNKLSRYQSASIIRFASIEGGTFLSAVAFGLTGNNYYLILFGLLIILYIMNKPSTLKLIDELNLESSEVRRLKSDET